MIQRLATGDITALDELRAAAAQQIVIQVDKGQLDIGEASVEDFKKVVFAAQQMLPTLEVGAEVQDEQFLQDLQNMVGSSQQAADAVATAFESMGYDVDVSYPQVSISDILPEPVQTGVSSVLNALGNTFVGPRFQGVHWDTSKTVQARVPQISIRRKGSGSGNSYAPKSSSGGSGGSGGGGSKGGSGGSGGSTPKEPSKVSKADSGSAENDIYQKVNATLEKLQDNYSKLQKVRERT